MIAINPNYLTLFSFRRIWLFLISVFLFTTIAQPGWSQQNDFKYFFKSIDVRNAFVILTADKGFTAQISSRVVGSLKNVELNGDFDTVMNNLADVGQSDWFRSGNNVFVSHKSERLTRYIKLGSSMNADKAKDMLKKSNLSFERFPIETSGASNVISVNAPPKYIAIVETVLLNEVKESPEDTKKFVKTDCPIGKSMRISVIKNGYQNVVKGCSRT